MRFVVVVCWVEELSGRRECYNSDGTVVGRRVPERRNSEDRPGYQTICVGTGSPTNIKKGLYWNV